MRIIDLHCDHLYKLQQSKTPLDSAYSPELDTSLERLRAGGVGIQAFAIFVDPKLPADQAFVAAKNQIELFYTQVLTHPGIRHIWSWEELDNLQLDEIGVFLTLEGLDCIGNELSKLDELLDEGILSVGLTWNPANLVADGCGEPRGAGLSEFGHQVVSRLNERGILVDTAHLAEAGFWEVLELAEHPIVSHANARALCDHPRNLTDKQIQALIAKGIPLHIVYYPWFLTGIDEASVDDVIRHMHHIVELGGEDILAYGSDFDGINVKVQGLEHAGNYPDFLKRLEQEFTSKQIEKFAAGNFLRYIQRKF